MNFFITDYNQRVKKPQDTDKPVLLSKPQEERLKKLIYEFMKTYELNQVSAEELMPLLDVMCVRFVNFMRNVLNIYTPDMFDFAIKKHLIIDDLEALQPKNWDEFIGNVFESGITLQYRNASNEPYERHYEFDVEIYKGYVDFLHGKILQANQTLLKAKMEE